MDILILGIGNTLLSDEGVGVRLAAALERIPVARKIEVGERLLERLSKPKESATTW